MPQAEIVAHLMRDDFGNVLVVRTLDEDEGWLPELAAEEAAHIGDAGAAAIHAPVAGDEHARPVDLVIRILAVDAVGAHLFRRHVDVEGGEVLRHALPGELDGAQFVTREPAGIAVEVERTGIDDTAFIIPPGVLEPHAAEHQRDRLGRARLAVEPEGLVEGGKLAIGPAAAGAERLRKGPGFTAGSTTKTLPSGPPGG